MGCKLFFIFFLSRGSKNTFISDHNFFFTYKLSILTRGGTRLKHRPGMRQTMGGNRPKLNQCMSYYQWRYLHMHILVAPTVCIYCNSPMIAFEHLTKNSGSPIDSLYKIANALTTWPSVSVRVWRENKADTLTTGIGLHHSRDRNS